MCTSKEIFEEIAQKINEKENDPLQNLKAGPGGNGRVSIKLPPAKS